LYPHLWDYELAYGPVVDALRPDLIHANDFRMLGIGARAKLRARAAGRDVRLVWDAHGYIPGVRPAVDDGRWLPAMCAHEAEYARHADEVVTVSEELAELLRKRHRLARLPTVVLNAPETASTKDTDDAPDLRGQCGIGPADPLLVYNGVAAPRRGLDIMVRALPMLPDAHVALVVDEPDGPYATELGELAAAIGVAARVHVLPFVPYHQAVSHLAAADVGVVPIHHWPNHEIALTPKFFEYSHARLPVVVSDVRTMARTTHNTGQGEVFWADNVNDYVRAVNAVLADPASYRGAYERADLLGAWTWEHQARVLDTAYAKAMARSEGPRAIASPINPHYRQSSKSTFDSARSADTRSPR
jgi:glycosyltransferase involved in cell wall biosynthesis